jgi:hypothetical protein
MVPVAVSVPQAFDIEVDMELENWAFGKITGAPAN